MRFLYLMLVSPYRALVWLFVEILVLGLRFTSYPWMSHFISQLPFHPGMKIRSQFYRRTLRACGEKTTFQFGTIVSYREISIGRNVRIGPYNMIGFVDIGDDVMTAAFCSLLSGGKQHHFDRLDVPMVEQGGERGKITVGSDVWIGNGATILSDVGKGCIVGAASVVTKPVQDYDIVVGNPARVVRSRLEATSAPEEAH